MKADWEDAIRRGDVEDVRAMLQVGRDPNAKDRYGQTAVMLAALLGHTEVVRLLVEAGADLDVTAKYGLSALMLAVVNHQRDIVDILAGAGADRTLRGTDAGFAGKTALDLAEDRHDAIMVARLRTR
jgi:ankyrin repeat protein